MHPFTLTHPTDKSAAILAGAGADTKFIAGGTNLVDLMKMNVEQPRHLVNITALALEGIEEMADGSVRIGALVRNSDLAYHPLIRKKYAVLSEALLSGASAQLRNMATVGGNLMQRTRCPYFYNTASACNKRVPGSGCAAIKGYNRSHAILGGSEHCVATHPSDMCVALVALGALVIIEGPNGNREVPIWDFHQLPGDTPHIETVLKPGELITAVQLPKMNAQTVSHYLKVRDRASYEFALVSVAVVLDRESQAGKSSFDAHGNVRIAMGGICTKPFLLLAPFDDSWNNVSPGAASFEMVAKRAMNGARPLKYNAFKVALAKKTLVQALETTFRIS